MIVKLRSLKKLHVDGPLEIVTRPHTHNFFLSKKGLCGQAIKETREMRTECQFFLNDKKSDKKKVLRFQHQDNGVLTPLGIMGSQLWAS